MGGIGSRSQPRHGRQVAVNFKKNWYTVLRWSRAASAATLVLTSARLLACELVSPMLTIGPHEPGDLELRHGGVNGDVVHLRSLLRNEDIHHEENLDCLDQQLEGAGQLTERDSVHASKSNGETRLLFEDHWMLDQTGDYL